MVGSEKLDTEAIVCETSLGSMSSDKSTYKPFSPTVGKSRLPLKRRTKRSPSPSRQRGSKPPLISALKRRIAALEAQNNWLRTEGALWNGAASFRQVIDASPVPLSVDDMQGTIEYLNEKFIKKFGYSREELPTSAAWFARAYPDPEYRRQVAQQWQAMVKKGLRTGREIGPLEVEVTCKDGSVRRVDFIGRLLGKKLLLAANDLTERERLEQQIVKISEQERERIGQDLHDGLCQLLSGIKFKTTLLEQKLEAKTAAEAADARALEDLLNSAIQQAKNVARGLHPVELEAGGLMAALESLADSVSSVYGIACVCPRKRSVLVHDHITATHFYRIAQEAINNAVRHGHAQRISVRLTRNRNGLRLTVQDNGVGFATKTRRKTGMGLHLMRYRARAMGAHLELRSQPHKGTIIKCWLRTAPI